ncbi:cupin domain-containing protein [Oxalobacter aliiformigenes]|uniref:Cupin domain-containing protein n=1 Tax=Oxalobacter aliiformigenes TaxID=2946593 RepID=A0ABY7JFT8_9BURK|nr:cupin domain-containing protein [Oxalobacter aliiformigenes]WAV92728.1 cupin domain-containing protein [Oxalobacter aliiformigenes]WAV95766.1 cupin domain-containing protein [Oxalobacter aliiformigenes]WAV96442.1 cupin domain-containing protein [Oxalobacter aliiformigenes]
MKSKISKRVLVTTLFFTALLSTAGIGHTTDIAGQSLHQTITRNGTQQSFTGSDRYFTGNVKVDMLFTPTTELPASGATVTFEPGARSAWHTHPAGQTLIVTSGIGLTQEWGKPIVEIHTGDIVRCPAGIKHWHGAKPDSAMTHIAITGDVHGKNVEWLEKVTDEQYRGR